jgi:hypothetical protein
MPPVVSFPAVPVPGAVAEPSSPPVVSPPVLSVAAVPPV